MNVTEAGAEWEVEVVEGTESMWFKAKHCTNEIGTHSQ